MNCLNWIPGQSRNDKLHRTYGVTYIDIDDIPEGWILTTIAEIADLNPPKPPQNALPPHTPVTFLTMPAVDAESGVISRPETRPFSQVRKGYTAFREGDVIMAKITPCMENGKAAVVRDLKNGLGFGSTEFHVLRSNGSALPEYIYHFIRQEYFRKAAEAKMTGSVGQKRVPTEFLKQSEILLPPLAEQKHIVAKVEELLMRVNATKERLAKVSLILKRFRQAVFAAACSGRLTADWREQQTVLEAASVLLERLQGQHLRPDNDVFSENDLPEIPKNWVWAKVGQLGDVITGSTPSKKEASYFGGLIPFFKPTDLDAGYNVEKSIDSLTEEGAEIARILPPLAVMVTCIGATIGKTGLGRVGGATNQQINSVVTNHEFVSPYWLFWTFTSPWVQEQIKLHASETTLPILNKGRFEKLFLPFPPLNEQREIVRRVEAMFKLADAVKKRVAAAKVRSDKLTQAILAKAFRGELVPTEAELAHREGRSYESASDLLARIKSERESKGASKLTPRNRNQQKARRTRPAQ